MPKRYNTPHRSRVVKTRLSEDEYADFTARLAPYGISQSEFLRQALAPAPMAVEAPPCAWAYTVPPEISISSAPALFSPPPPMAAVLP